MASREVGGSQEAVVLGLAWAMGFLMWGLLLAVGALLPSIQEELGLGFTVRSMVLALPFLSLALAAIPGGYLADRRGIRWTVGVGSMVAVAGAGFRAAPGPLPVLLAAGATFGVGLGLVIPNLPKLVSAGFREGRGGLATGIYSTGLIAGSAVGIYFTAPLADALGSWRAALAAWAAAGGAVVLAWWLILPQARTSGTIRSPSRDLLRRRELWLLAFLFAAGNASYFFLVGAYPDYLVALGIERAYALGQLALLIALGIPAMFLAPYLSDRIGLRRPFLWGPHLLIAALLLALPTLPAAAVPLASAGFGFAEMAIFALALLLPVDLFRTEEVGRASGIVISLAYVGALAGPVGFGAIVDATGSLESARVPFAGLSVVSVIAAFLLPETGGAERP